MNAADLCQSAIFQLPNESRLYDVLNEVHSVYKPIHTYLSIVLCAIGTAIAACDNCVLFSNLIYTTHFTFIAFSNCHPRHWSYGWAIFLISHAHLSLISHTSSVWLSVMLALIRYLTLRNRGKISGIQIGAKHSYIAIASVIMFVLVFNLPNFLTYKIVETPLRNTCEITDPTVINALAYFPEISDLAMEWNCMIFRAAFWVSGVAFKMAPCILLTLLVWLLTRILNEVKENRMRLLKGSTRNLVQPNGITALPEIRKDSRNSLANIAQASQQQPRTNSVRGGHYRGRTDRTTRMLLAIVCVVLVTELPQGIMAVLIGILSTEFRKYVYNGVGDILDLLSLCGACTTFVIYCSMSAQFRNEFRRVFIPAQVNCWLSPEGARRCSDAFFSKTATNFLHVDNGNANDHSVTISLITQANSVRRLSVDGDDSSPRNASSDFHRRSTQALLSDKDDSSLLLDTTSRNAVSAASNNHHQIEDDASPLLKPFDNHTHRHMDSSVSSAGSSPLPANNNNGVSKPNGSALA
ncbi:G-PROTEIN-RECEP-F1-2 domain-containing protein [Aphelenchoides bicaudatus]|nr:G-PROTEIN-RECEP-F1-2 domain-containing protein [Aphelenchoides bicaudatus]